MHAEGATALMNVFNCSPKGMVGFIFLMLLNVLEK